MPLYEYKCAACGEVFEVIQKFSDEPLHEHAECGGQLERLISPAALQFKGSGWYVTDYARNGSSGNGKTKSESSSSNKSDSAKPAAAPAKDSPSPAKSE